MFYKIYYGERVIFLCDEIDEVVQPFVHHDDAVFLDELNTHTLNTLLHELRQPSVREIVFFHPNLEELKEKVFKKFHVVRAGGGVVQNGKNEILLIFRRGKWDLPKGKLDDGETIERCAVREVLEETGLTSAKLSRPLCTTWHIYQEGSSFILKQTDWFRMKVVGSPELIPQQEEEITDITWAPTNDLEKYQENTFPSVKEVLGLL
ncbi:MAG: NUDIX hydrolase [Chitinophagaceae bacterium]